jgi:hypothetical protein
MTLLNGEHEILVVIRVWKVCDCIKKILRKYSIKHGDCANDCNNRTENEWMRFDLIHLHVDMLQRNAIMSIGNEVKTTLCEPSNSLNSIQ